MYIFVQNWTPFTKRTEKQTKRIQKFKNPKDVKNKRCENVKKINMAFENPKKLIVIILKVNMARFLLLLA